MGQGKYTVLYERNETGLRLCKIWFGPDGSYYVTVPYHPAKSALLMKMTVSFAAQSTSDVEQAVDLAETDEKRVKLAHHPDGFVQFSGDGVLSGKNADGTIKGVGLHSWSLVDGCLGPAFGITFWGLEGFDKNDAVRDGDILIKECDLYLAPEANATVLEGFYFTAACREFVFAHKDGSRWIQKLHPSGHVLNLRVLRPSDKCPLGGFLGLRVRSLKSVFSGTPSGFIVTSSTENVRQGDDGELVGDQLCCICPRPTGVAPRRSVNY